jgi:hypothetical protein
MSTFRARLIYALRLATRFIIRRLAKKVISLGRADRITQNLPPRQPLARKTEKQRRNPEPVAAGVSFQPALGMLRWLALTPSEMPARDEGARGERKCPVCGEIGSRVMQEIGREKFKRRGCVDGLSRGAWATLAGWTR